MLAANKPKGKSNMEKRCRSLKGYIVVKQMSLKDLVWVTLHADAHLIIFTCILCNISIKLLLLLHEDPHMTFFCTPHGAGIVKDARFWVTSNKLPTAKSNFFTVCAIISGQLFDKASHFLTRLRPHLAIEQLEKRLQFNICQRFAFSCSSRVIQNNHAWPTTQVLSCSILYSMYWRVVELK